MPYYLIPEYRQATEGGVHRKLARNLYRLRSAGNLWDITLIQAHITAADKRIAGIRAVNEYMMGATHGNLAR